MGAYDRYVFVRTLLLSFLASSVLTVSFVMSQTQGLSSLVVNLGMPFGIFLGVLASLVPKMAATGLIFGVTIGTVYFMLSARNQKEIIIQMALGVSPWRRFVPMALFALLVMIANVWLTNFAVPASMEYNRSLRNLYANSTSIENAVSPGRTVPIGRVGSIYLHSAEGAVSYRGGRLFDSTNPQAVSTTYGQRVLIRAEEDVISVFVFDGMKITEYLDGRLPSITYFTHLPITFGRNGTSIESTRVDTINSATNVVAGTRGGAGSARGGSSANNSGGTNWQSQVGRLQRLLDDEKPFAYVLQMGIEGTQKGWRALARNDRTAFLEFHRRIATTLAVPAIVLAVFGFLSMDIAMRRQPTGSLIAISIALLSTLFVGVRVISEAKVNPTLIYFIYLVPLTPLVWLAAKAWLPWWRLGEFFSLARRRQPK